MIQSELSIGIVQSDIIWEDKFHNFEKYESLLSHRKGYDIVVLPEMFSCGFSVNTDKCAEEPKGESFEWMQKMSKQMQSAFAASVPVRENNKIFNLFYFVMPDGSYFEYDKHHLFSYGGEHLLFSRGAERTIIDYKGWKIFPIVCYDLRFQVWNSNRFVDGNYDYDMAICVANWPQSRSHAWKTLLQARAIENQAWLLASNRVGVDGMDLLYAGDSMVVNPYGEIQNTASQIETVLEAKVSLDFLKSYREKFAFAADWDAFELI